ncbi:ABC transporter ATP-binding protein [Hyphomicrobium sp. CS1GBMeth3]|uniref:ABC transporter ATP-binding protein n=1 Tax=Hyphomicrobium sp. CS1GBMeth3 TaxID=1892845 RepID=UPI00093159EA|nr:ABC transporter ATP-binding protein [Hyphomicrobium sp. CS1GBMeth3]
MDAQVRPASIELVGITKEYRLYHRSVDRLVELFAPNGRVRHDTIRALSDVTLSVGAGERVGILGANGSGKSTLLKVISQVLTPTAGEVRVAGRVSALLELGIGFAGELTGRENIIQYGILQGLTRDDIASRCEEIIGFSEIAEYIDQPIRTYSSGMVLRLAFACAVFTDPDVLIIDEALSVGDSYFQAKCLHKIRSMLDRGITFLYVSHSADSVRSLCTRGVLMERGRVVLDGASIDVAREYERRAFIRASRYQGASAPDGEALTETKPGEASAGHLLDVVSDDATPSEREFARRVAAMRSGNGTVRITNIEVLDAEGGQTDVVAHGEPLTVRVSYRVMSVPAAHTSIGVGICDRLGNQLVHMNTLDKGIDLAGTTPGVRGSVVFQLVNLFCPGDFAVIVGCSTVSRHPVNPSIWLVDELHDYCVGGAAFTVPASSAQASLWGAVALPYEVEFGAVLPNEVKFAE